MPEISVVLPVKNGERYLAEAVASILWQTVSDLELIVVDDGSTDTSVPIVERYCERDRRVRLLRSTGVGISAALNHGMRHASGRYLARMDADDISVPSRLETQISAFESMPGVGLLGTRTIQFGARNGSPVVLQDPDLCRIALCLFNPLTHPSVMLRADLPDKHGIYYSTEYPYAQDYDWFSRLAQVTNIANIDDPLLFYRVHDGQVSTSRRTEQVKIANVIRTRNLADFYGIVPGNRLALLAQMGRKASQLGLPGWRESARAIRNVVLYT